MISFDFDKDCCGCHACMNACPVNAIKMEAASRGRVVAAIKSGKIKTAALMIGTERNTQSGCILK